MNELETALTNLRAAWTRGRPTRDVEPSAWRSAAGDDDELAALALAGHALDVISRPSPAALLAARRPLPALSVPLLPERLRPRFRRVLRDAQSWRHGTAQLVQLVAARGYAAHPTDWMPGADDAWTPRAYAPWQDWLRGEQAANRSDNADITAETYAELSWSERQQALRSLRAAKPADALAIIETRSAGEPAERRLNLVGLLSNRLSEADARFLESLAADRSERVRDLARKLLARLNIGRDTDALASELAAMLEFGKTGLLRRRYRLRLNPLKNSAQQARRRELFALVSPAALARALGTTELQLFEAVPDGDAADVAALVSAVAETGTDDAVRVLAELLMADEDSQRRATPLFVRLTREGRSALLPSALRHDDGTLGMPLLLVDDALGELPLSAFAGSAALSAAMTGAAERDRENAGPTHRLDQALFAFGLLLDAPGARALLAQLVGVGLSPVDPLVDLLHFNAALVPETAT